MRTSRRVPTARVFGVLGVLFLVWIVGIALSSWAGAGKTGTASHRNSGATFEAPPGATFCGADKQGDGRPMDRWNHAARVCFLDAYIAGRSAWFADLDGDSWVVAGPERVDVVHPDGSAWTRCHIQPDDDGRVFQFVFRPDRYFDCDPEADGDPPCLGFAMFSQGEADCPDDGSYFGPIYDGCRYPTFSTPLFRYDPANVFRGGDVITATVHRVTASRPTTVTMLDATLRLPNTWDDATGFPFESSDTLSFTFEPVPSHDEGYSLFIDFELTAGSRSAVLTREVHFGFNWLADCRY
jgi:hypothetical protein